MSFLLFVRAASDLDRACREVSEYFAYKSRQPLPGSLALHGVWIEPSRLFAVPQVLVPPSWHNADREFRLPESFGISGIWQLARLHAPAQPTHNQELRDSIIESLQQLTEGAAGRFAPVFTGGASREVIRDEWN